MGIVYEADHALLQRPCAIKIIRSNTATDPTMMARFEREVKTMASLNHPNVAEIYDYGWMPDGTFYYVMELLPGISLETLVSLYGPVPIARVVHLLRQLCDALAEMHARGLVHRDIKPSNILFGQRGLRHDVVKLVDYGLVRDNESDKGANKLTVQGMAVGTPQYMSPEQATGSAVVDGRGDLYSLGLVAFYLLTGEKLFARKTFQETLLAQVSDPPLPPSYFCPDIPKDLEAVIMRCLEKDPERRWPTAQCLDEALAAASEDRKWSRAEAESWWKQHGERSGCVSETESVKVV
jgi:serine/threonine-protein kinase